MDVSNQEIELRLVIVGEGQQKIADEIASLDRCEKYIFTDAGIQRINDIYFDTEGGALAGQNFGIRIRVQDESVFVTIKGKPELLENGSVRRMELEQKWGLSALKMVQQFFWERKIDIEIQSDGWQNKNPKEFFEQAGLRVIHERYNQRSLKNVLDDEKTTTRLVEMAIDEMKFPLRDRELKLFEIELEQKSADGNEAIEKIKDCLLGKFGGKLLLWKYSKLATGIALQRLIGEDEFRKTIDRKGHLTGRSYQMIEVYFQNHGVEIG